MNIAVLYSSRAVKQLGKLDVSISKRLTWEIVKKVSATDPLVGAKALRGNLSDEYRYRIGDYRVIFTINKQGEIIILNILDIGHRKNVYR